MDADPSAVPTRKDEPVRPEHSVARPPYFLSHNGIETKDGALSSACLARRTVHPKSACVNKFPMSTKGRRPRRHYGRCGCQDRNKGSCEGPYSGGIRVAEKLTSARAGR